MREKIVWITVALVFGIAFILLNIFPPTVYHSSRNTWWIMNLGVTIVFIGLPVFPLTALIALILPKQMSYELRFSSILPFFLLLLALLQILGTLANAR